MPTSSHSSFAAQINPRWTPEFIRRTLTDEPGKGMGAPFSDAQAQLFLRACGLAQPELAENEADPELLNRMLKWCISHQS
jgi:hypothetical protein